MKRRRGFTLVLAIAVLGLAGMTLAAIAGQVAQQHQRTTATVEDAQADQLLAAAVRFARAQAVATPADGPVPTPLGTAVLAWSGDPAHRSCAIDVRFGQSRRGVTVRFDGPRAIKLAD